MIAIIDYGMGNLASVYNAFKKVGHDKVVITSEPQTLNKADGLVLPGVGAFGDAINNLKKSNLIEPIIKNIEKGKPFLGICLGFQLLFEKSYENGIHKGLGIFSGEIVRFETGLPVPQIGWNQANFKKNAGLFDGLGKSVYFYFDHAYYPQTDDKDIIVAETEYDIKFTSAVMRGNVFAVQFHPEKSHKNGLSVIKRFSELSM